MSFIQSVDANDFCVQQTVVGVQGEIKKTLMERVNVSTQESPPSNLDTLAKEVSLGIKNTLAALGYFEPKITPRIYCLNGQWHIDYNICQGRLLTITRLDLKLTGEATCDPAFQALLQHFSLREGDAMRSKCYQEAKSSLSDLAAQRGYFAAKLNKNAILINLKTYQATVILSFDSGPRYYFGPLHFQPSPYCPSLLQRFAPFRFGQPYQNCQIVKFQENLSNANFFQQVTVTPKPEEAHDSLVPIEVALIPQKPLQYSLGFGYGTDSGLRGICSVQWRRLNPMGHQFEMLLQPSQRLNHYQAAYTIPGRCPATDSYKLSAVVDNQRLPTNGVSRSEKIEASHVSDFWGWRQTASLALRDEHSIPTDDRPLINSTMLLPSINWTRMQSDDPLTPNHGYQLNLSLRGATKKLVSNTDFIQVLAQGKWLFSPSLNTRLIAKGQLGYTFISDVDDLPITLQFYTGGAQTVRGYQFQGIGPGKTLMLGSLEFQRRIKGNIYGAIFFDSASVTNSLDRFNSGVGVGVVWRSPIGAIEITLAEALNKPGHPKLLQISMGPEL